MLVIIKILLSVLFFSAEAKLLPPQVINYPKRREINLNEPVIQALKKADPLFKVMKAPQFEAHIPPLYEGLLDQQPMAVTGYFNRDQYHDVAVMGLTKKGEKDYVNTYMVLSDTLKGQYNAVLMDSRPLKSQSAKDGFDPEKRNLWESYLIKATSREKRNLNLKTKTNVVKIENYNNNSTVFYFKDGKLNRIDSPDQVKIMFLKNRVRRQRTKVK